MLLTFEKAIPGPERLASWVGMAACIGASQAALADVLSGLEPSETVEPLDPIEVRVVYAIQTVPLGLGIHAEHLPKSWINGQEHAARRPVDDVCDDPLECHQLFQRCVSVYATFSRKVASDVLARTADKPGAL